MKERPPAFQFYPRQFTGDEKVLAMDLEAIGAHILLMCIAAASPEGYRIEADEHAIRMYIRNPVEERWQEIKRQLLKGAWKLTADQKWWVQEGLQRTLERQKGFSEQQRQRANSRWSGHEPQASYRDNADILADSMPEGCSSSSSSSSSSNKSICSEVNHGGIKPPKSTQVPSEAGTRLAHLLRSRMLQNNCRAKITEPQLRNWAREADRMLRLDHRTEQQIEEMIEFSQRDQFWSTNILSMGKLRQHFDRFIMLLERSGGKHSDCGAESEEAPPTAPRWPGLQKSKGEPNT